MKIYYLDPNTYEELDYEGSPSDIDPLVIEHGICLTPEEFKVKFNYEEISDLGYIAIEEDK